MMTEFEVRRRVAAICNAEMPPLSKARMLLRIGRTLNAQAKNLGLTTHHVEQTADRNATACLTRMVIQARHLRQDVRDEALSVLRGEPASGFLS